MSRHDPLQHYYAARAPEYDRIYAKPERQADLRAIEAWVQDVFAGRSLLELACGTGYWTQFLAPVATGVLALDASAETLAIARARVPAGAVRFVVGDAYAPPTAKPPFDAAFAGFWYSHVPRGRLRAFLLGLHGVLAPGARVVFLDNRYVEGSSTPIAERDAGGDTWQLRPLDDGTTHRVLKNFPTDGEVREALDGLADGLRLHRWTYFWAAEYSVRS